MNNELYDYDPAQYGLYLASRGYWLEGDRWMHDFNLKPCNRCPALSAGGSGGHECDVIELQDRQRFVPNASRWLHYAEGWVQKKGDRSIVWRDRYFVLCNRQLSWYNKSSSSLSTGTTQPLGTISLQPGQFSVTPVRNTAVASQQQAWYTFELILGKSYRLRFPGHFEAQMWWRILCALRLPDLSSYSTAGGSGGNSVNHQLSIRQFTVPSSNTSICSAFADDSDQSDAGAGASCKPGHFVVNNSNKKRDNSDRKANQSDSNSSSGEVNSDDIASSLTHAVSNRRPLFETFCHLRLVDAVKKSRNPNYKDPSPLLVDGPATHIDVQGDKLGFLYKKGSYNRSLKYRLFVLRNKILYYYKMSSARGRNGGGGGTSSLPRTNSSAINVSGCSGSVGGGGFGHSLQQSNYVFAGLINLEGCKMYTDRKRGKKSFIIRVVAPAKSYLICTDDREEYQDWLDAFEFICGIQLEDMNAAIEKMKRKSVTVIINDDHNEGDEGEGSDGAASCSSSSTADDENDDEGDEVGGGDNGNRRVGRRRNNNNNNSNNKGKHSKPHKIKLTLDLELMGQPDMEGTLWKQGNDRLGKWRERHFMLIGRSLFYGPTSRRLQPFGSIPLSICRLRNVSDSTNNNSQEEDSSSSLSFELIVTNEDLCDPVLRVYRLRASDRLDYDAWQHILQIHVCSNE